MSQLVVDLGGTHCRVGLADRSGLLTDTCRIYQSADYSNLPDLLRAYLETAQTSPVSALCIGVAGPVRNGSCHLTNLPWVLEPAALAAATGAAQVYLLNDLQAQAYALDDLPAAALTRLRIGAPDPLGPRLVLGLGTGCNIAVAHRCGCDLFVSTSESGHMTLPDAAGFRSLFDALRSQVPHLPLEAALSGPGLTAIHKHLTGDTRTPAQIIAEQPHKTLQTFVSLLGLVAGNLCLSHMATGGLYLIGGVARATVPFLLSMGFEDTLDTRGPYTGLMQDIPITLIIDDMAALKGCVRYLAQP